MHKRALILSCARCRGASVLAAGASARTERSAFAPQKNIVQTAIAAGQFKTLVKLVKRAGLVGALSEPERTPDRVCPDGCGIRQAAEGNLEHAPSEQGEAPRSPPLPRRQRPSSAARVTMLTSAMNACEEVSHVPR